MQQLLAVAVGGCLGCVARYGISTWLHRRWPQWPGGTLAVNVLGCLLIGVLMSLATLKSPDGQPRVSETMQRLLVTGFLGGMTTFSAFAWESIHLMLNRNEYALAFASVAANVVLGFGAVCLGRWIAMTMA